MNKYLFIIVVLAGILFQCSRSKTIESKTNILISHTTVICSSDTTQSYELYLPSNYSSEKDWPVLLCFDPHARANIPVDLLKESAEKYGYIIAASNNSKNNHPKTKYVTDLFISDVLNHYAINKNRIYTLGFSGGGRIASNIHLQKSNVKGVISCTAGINSENISNTQKQINFYGIVGNEDFNFQELINLRNSPKTENLNMQIQIFDGDHDWPPKQYLDEAILWMEFNAMKDKLIPKNNKLISDFFNNTESLIREAINNKNYTEAFLLSKKGISFLSGLKNTGIFEEYLNEVINDIEYQKQVKRLEKLYKQEFLLRNSLVKDYNTKDIEWWNSTILSMKEMRRNAKEKESSLVISRVLNYMSMVSYIYTSQSLNNKDINATNKYLKLYEMLDPENKDCHYFKALYFDKTNQLDSAKASYKKAINYGFNDFKKADKELSFK